ILRNILTNAIKYTPRGGMILIEAKETSSVEISITDNGIGMSDTKIQEILGENKFLSTKGTESEQGSGIGLMITLELIEKLGGQLDITSKEGQGTTMIVRLKK
ncbi:MAG: sensor histidine kinase, partial [Bacteroidales bacterium]|nr:sensor histidine kinase [Bacteroidales bacterium]